MASMHFRAGTVAVVRNSVGQVLAFERSDQPGQWQLPQGGLDVGESASEGAWRELAEETGLGPAEVELAAEYPEWTAYEWPSGVPKKDGGRLGQAQRWFVFRLRADDIVPRPDGVEFVDWKWADPEWLVEQVVEFRRASYRRVFESAEFSAGQVITETRPVPTSVSGSDSAPDAHPGTSGRPSA